MEKDYVVHYKFTNQVKATSEKEAIRISNKQMVQSIKDDYIDFGKEDVEKITEVRK